MTKIKGCVLWELWELSGLCFITVSGVVLNQFDECQAPIIFSVTSTHKLFPLNIRETMLQKSGV